MGQGIGLSEEEKIELTVRFRVVGWRLWLASALYAHARGILARADRLMESAFRVQGGAR